MTNFEILKAVVPEVIAANVPVLIAAGLLHRHLEKRRARKRNVVEQAVDTTVRASSATIAALEAEGFRFSRIKGEIWYFIKDAKPGENGSAAAPSDDDRRIGGGR